MLMIPFLALWQETVSPNVLAMIKAFNRLALKVTTEILAEKTPRARAKVIQAFIKVSDKYLI